MGRRSSAGASSQRKYDDLVRQWRRRNRKLFVVLTVVCWGLVVASLVLTHWWPSQTWILGFAGGSSFGFWMSARLNPPGWIENWQVGAWGEQATAKALKPLEADGWVVLHDLPAGRGNIDHIVVGPGGVFLLDSKRLSGTVTVDDDGVHVRRFDDPDLAYEHTGSRHLLHLARQAHDRVLEASRLNVWVMPVMVLWAEFPQRVAEQRCVFVHGEELAQWLRSQPGRIAPARIEQVAAAVRASWAHKEATG